MAKIIKEGKTPKERALEIKIHCPNCDTVFQLEPTDYFVVDGTVIVCTCGNPKCSSKIKIDLSRGTNPCFKWDEWEEMFKRGEDMFKREMGGMGDSTWSWSEIKTTYK